MARPVTDPNSGPAHGPAHGPVTGARDDPTSAVSLRALGKRLGRGWVLADLSLEVSAGRLVVLRGANGAGKTTLLRVLATRLRPSRGSAAVFGFDVVREGAEVRRRIGLVSVVGGNYPILTARENLRLAAALGGREGADVGAVLAAAGLLDAADRLVRTYSSGMKKRLGIARLLLLDPELWLLDEPYAALDEGGKALVDEALRAARARGRTVLMASHEPERSAALADAVLELEGGRLRRAGTPARAPSSGAAHAPAAPAAPADPGARRA